MKKTLLSAFVGCLCLTTTAQAQSEVPTDFLNQDVSVTSHVVIPTDKLIVMQLETGEMVIATGDGKFLIKNATVFSTLATKIVNTPEEMKAAATASMSDMHIQPEEELAGFTLHPDASVFGGTLFVATDGCPSCTTFIEQLDKEHPDKRFRIAMAPVFTPDDYKHTLLAQCNASPDDALKALYYGEWSEAQYPRKTPNDPCKEAVVKVNSTVAALQIMSSDRMGLPTFINNKKGTIVGLPQSKTQLTKTIMDGIKL